MAFIQLLTQGTSASLLLTALKLGSLRLASLVKREPSQQQQQQQPTAAGSSGETADEPQKGSSEVVARIRATAAG